jgi:hypothetical protein
MGVGIGEAREDEMSGGVQFLGTGWAGACTNRNDLVCLDEYISGLRAICALFNTCPLRINKAI